MKRELYTPIIVFPVILLSLIVLSGCSAPAQKQAETNHGLSKSLQDRPETYYGKLKSLLTRKTLHVRPKAAERDVNLIEIEKGAAGVCFGASMDDVLAVWGKPCGFHIDGFRDVWDLSIGACRFGFIDNQLVAISIHSATLKDAYLKNGIGFGSSYDEVKSVYGEPLEATNFNLEYSTANGYLVTFHFVADNSSLGKRKLINISIYHPDSGK
jgi:hypothetical protein